MCAIIICKSESGEVCSASSTIVDYSTKIFINIFNVYIIFNKSVFTANL